VNGSEAESRTVFLVSKLQDSRSRIWGQVSLSHLPHCRPDAPRSRGLSLGHLGPIQLMERCPFKKVTKIAHPLGFSIFREDDVGLFSKDIKTMDDLLLHGLQDIYYAEQQITKALPKMIDLASNRDLAQGLKLHLEETNKQIERLDQVFKKLGKKPSGTDCPAIDGLIKESDETSGEIDDKSVLDAAIVASAQAVEHYEISRYGTLIAWAEELGHDDIVRFLTTNLNEEKAANTKLNTIALRKGVNRKAAS
jgi:ferritin-like metal-binding protein YciE